MEYRREIDGLRALAVVPVILFHAGFELFSGGFVGVDVFFVISGYLITSIIISDLAKGDFSIVRFYERRMRRILPALFCMMAACIPAAFWLLLPNELKKFSKSLVAVSLYFSNIQFFRESGYFDVAAELKPLLHTWSLAVEEQFYLFFPVFLILVWKHGRKTVFAALLALSLLSLALSQVLVAVKPDASFFLLPARIWELAAGSLTAVWFHARGSRVPGGLPGQALGVLGVLLVVFSMLFYEESTPFPGLYALLPVLGTVLIIAFSWRDTLVGRFLGNPVLVAVGLVSYSAYLWHQPLFVFARHLSVGEPGAAVYAGLCAATFAVSYLSWRFVEQPFRKKNRVGRRAVFLFALGGTLFFLVSGTAMQKIAKLEFREVLPAQIVRSFEGSGRQSECFDKSKVHLRDDWTCTLGDRNGTASFLVAGDSHALSLLDVFDSAARDAKMTGVFVGASGCPPLQGVHALRHDQGDKNCHELNKRILAYVRSSGIKSVYLVGRWTYYTNGGYDGRNFSYLGLNPDDERKLENTKAAFEHGVRKTIDDFSGIGAKVHFVAQVPQQIYDPKQVYRKAYVDGGLSQNVLDKFSVRKEKHTVMQSYVSSVFDRYEGRCDVLSFEDMFCDADKCRIGMDNGSYYLDDDHLSSNGARTLYARVRSILDGRTARSGD